MYQMRLYDACLSNLFMFVCVTMPLQIQSVFSSIQNKVMFKSNDFGKSCEAAFMIHFKMWKD
jgi:hypothetical protein